MNKFLDGINQWAHGEFKPTPLENIVSREPFDNFPNRPAPVKLYRAVVRCLSTERRQTLGFAFVCAFVGAVFMWLVERAP